MDSDAQGEVGAQRKTKQISRSSCGKFGKGFNGIESFRKECAVKQAFIQMMRFSVISQIQPANGKSPVKIIGTGGEDIG